MSGIVLYDGYCRFCTGQVRFISRNGNDDRFHLVPLQTDEGKSILRSAGMSEADLDTVVYQRDGCNMTRSSAVLNILKDRGGWSGLLYVFIIIPPFFRDFFYGLIARNRHRLTGRTGR
jgi:predicted DCC family thiol-disulfide oxidoreductase YuxK